METCVAAGGGRVHLGRKKRVSGRCRHVLKLVLGVTLLASLGVASAAEKPQHGASVKVLLRYDDYTRDSSAELEQGLLGGLHQFRIPLLVGVVPFVRAPYPGQATLTPNQEVNLGAEKFARLKQSLASGDVEIALHGFNHQTNFVIDGKPSEFAGLPLERQRQLLALGKAALEQSFGAPVRVFTPPYNAFDRTTVRAMEQAGFKILSAGVRPIQDRSTLLYIPGTAYPQKMRKAVEAALSHGAGDKLIVVVMHPYDFSESEDAIPSFRKEGMKISVQDFLRDIRWTMAQPNVSFVSVSDELGSRGDLSAERVSANDALVKSSLRALGLAPTGLSGRTPDGFLIPQTEADAMRRGDYLLALGIHGGFTFLAYVLSSRLNRVPAVARRRPLQRRSLAALGAVVVGLGYLRGFYILKTVCLVSAFGWFLGTFSVAAGGLLAHRWRGSMR